MKSPTPYTNEQTGKTVRPVAAIEHGTVLDHISAGKAMLLYRLLKLDAHHQQVTVGLNLPSTRFGYKDILKVEGWELSSADTSQVAVFAPYTTVSIIKDYHVIKKYSVVLPEVLEGVVLCPNRNCVTNFEETVPLFRIREFRKEIQFTCKYCEKVFSQHEVAHYDL